jgi:hypothetical protein
MTANADNNQVKAGSAGAIEAAVAAMRAHPTSAAVQDWACVALVGMNRMTANDDNRVKAGSAGAIEAVVAAMGAHATDRRHAGESMPSAASYDFQRRQQGQGGQRGCHRGGGGCDARACSARRRARGRLLRAAQHLFNAL